MPQFKVMLSSHADVSFSQEKVFTYDDEKWEDMSREERQGLIESDAEQFLHDTVDWDYKIVI